MAYTYDDFYRKATESNMLSQYDDKELEIARQHPEYGMASLNLRQQMGTAQTPEQKLLAQETLNQVRKGYSPAPVSSYYGKPFEWGGEKEYQAALDRLSSRPAFTWDPETDPRYQAYGKAYTREGQRATENALARASALTGGRPSSYAIGAAAQAGNYYAGKQADIIPTLYQQAYGQHKDNFNTDLGILNALGQDRNFAYQAYQKENEQAYQRALNAYNMGERSPEIAEILGITYVPPTEEVVDLSGGYGGPRGPKNPNDPAGTTILAPETIYMGAEAAGASKADLNAYLTDQVNKGSITPGNANALANGYYHYTGGNPLTNPNAGYKPKPAAPSKKPQGGISSAANRFGRR